MSLSKTDREHAFYLIDSWRKNFQESFKHHEKILQEFEDIKNDVKLSISMSQTICNCISRIEEMDRDMKILLHLSNKIKLLSTDNLDCVDVKIMDFLVTRENYAAKWSQLETDIVNLLILLSTR